MIVLLPIVDILLLLAASLSLLFCIKMASASLTIAIIIAVVLYGTFLVSFIFTVKESKKADKPYYLIPLVVFTIVSLLLFVFQNEIATAVTTILQPIGPGSLPPDLLN